ncbi:hypothetical protein SK128_003395 [Halocaridina rubra]|uniref:Uncharacterized protein n=1 Tax=Halocaridina rubra TaxID=373956 RepID=A0AAN8ZVR1_HALRR
MSVLAHCVYGSSLWGKMLELDFPLQEPNITIETPSAAMCANYKESLSWSTAFCYNQSTGCEFFDIPRLAPSGICFYMPSFCQTGPTECFHEIQNGKLI